MNPRSSLMTRILALSAILLAAAVPATAQSLDSAKPTSAKAKDPNRKICEEFKETGSRLAGRRVCMTAAEWQAQRQDNRDDVERAQKSVYVSNNN